ncbi:MAG TPA: hypothetical protein VLF17_06320, partial [Candidatus Nitrosotenuis sp.]|nr:hypothetical protein [Candidatus Nitrosotenuis sp.]
NPYAYTTNATDYLDLTTWFNFVVSDGDRFDSDPTPGIIELNRVNNGTYSIMQIKSSPGFGMSSSPSASDEIFGTTGFSYVTNTYVNFTGSSVTTIDAPNISDQTLDKLATQGGAKINGISMTSANDLPPAKLVGTDQKRTITPPNSIVFTSTFAGNTSPSTLFTTLGIPTYAAPKDTTTTGSTSFVPPLFVAPTTGGGNFILSPVIDELTPGSNVVLRFDQIDQGTTHPLLDTIDLPFNTQATNVGISVRMDTSNPTGISIPSGNVALYLNVDGNGGVDLSDPNIYSSNPALHFNLEKSGSSCPDGVAVYLEDGGHWHEVTPSATLDSVNTHTCSYSIDVEHFSSYLIGTESAGGHDHGSSEEHTTHAAAGHAGHSHSMGAMGSMEHGDHKDAYVQITKDLNIFEIEYDLSKGIARITVGSTGPVGDLEVQVYSEMGGKRYAHLANPQPTQLFTQGMKRYVFEVPLESNETYFRVSVENSKYNLNQSVRINGQYNKIIPWFANIQDGTNHEGMDHSSITPVDTNMDSGYATKFNGDNKIITYNGNQFQITYEMAGGIKGVEIDEESKSARFLLDYVAGGDLLLQVPRTLIDADNDNFIVLLEASPERQIDYEIVSSTAEYYTMKVNLPADAKTLTIVGTKVVPEFGVFSSLVLSALIAGIMIILKTQKHMLQTGTFGKSTKIA